MPKKRGSRLFQRNGRYYVDLRDLGGKREPLIPPGQKLATRDLDVANELAAARVRALEAEAREAERHQTRATRDRVLLGIRKSATLHDYAARHLELKAENSEVTDRTIADMERRLKAAVDFFGAARDLRSITVDDVQDWVTHLLRTKFRGKLLSKTTVRMYLNALSNLYKRALSESYAEVNPAAALMDKPKPARHEAEWLEIPDAALLLEAARTWKPDGDAGAHPAAFEIVATFLLTGGRRAEVMGLMAEDISFDRSVITFRPNRYRRLKNAGSARTVPLWPQLREILQRYIFKKGGPKSGLLFPPVRPAQPSRRRDPASYSKDEPRMVTDLRKSFDAIGERCGFAPGEIRPKRFRTTYATARLQTLDRGHPVAVWTVSREMGHNSTSMLERIYGKLGTIRHRSEELEYRPEHFVHVDGYAERLRALRVP